MEFITRQFRGRIRRAASDDSHPHARFDESIQLLLEELEVAFGLLLSLAIT